MPTPRVLKEFAEEERQCPTLPPELRDEQMYAAEDVSTGGRAAFRIVFDQEDLPDGYWNPKPEGWEIEHAGIEWQNTETGILRHLRQDKACVSVVVAKDMPGGNTHRLEGDV
jgi:hypothetical protein